MPTPTIPDGELFFNATLYTGNGGNLTVTNGAAGQSFQPDFVWTKSRSNGSTNNLLEDVIRGPKNSLLSNGTNSELARGINAFLSNGFSFNDDGAGDGNASGQTYVAWQWKAGGAAVTNTAGSISSQVSANTTSGFSVVTYTGNNTNSTVGHGLGVAPSMIIVKSRSFVDQWGVYHSALPAPTTSALFLQSTGAVATGQTCWNSTAPSSSVFSIGSGVGFVNSNGQTYVAYCWTPIAGYSAFGSYTGNGSTDGTFVYLGFRPRWVMIKHTNMAGNNWRLVDTSRLGYNADNYPLFPSLADGEAATVVCDMLSNGIKFRSTAQGVNGSGDSYIYAAFAENPFKYANAR